MKTLSIIWSIAKNTFKETARSRLFIGLMIVGALAVLGTLLLSSLSLGQDARVITDFGLAIIYLFSIIIAIFLGSSLIHAEFEKKTAYFILTQPVSRTQLIIGKILGLFLILFIANLILLIFFLPIVWIIGKTFPAAIIMAVLFQFVESCLIASLAALFSTISSPITATIFTVLFFIIGHSLSSFLILIGKGGTFISNFFKGLYYLLPNLEKFDLRLEAAHAVYLPPAIIVFLLLYALFFIVIFIMLAALALTAQDV